VLQGLERFGQDCIVVAGDRVLILVFTWLAILNCAGLFGLAAAFLLARIVAVFSRSCSCRTRPGQLRFSVDVALWRDLQREGVPIGVFLVVLNVYSYIDVVMLASSARSWTRAVQQRVSSVRGAHLRAGGVSRPCSPGRGCALWKVDRARSTCSSRVSVLGGAAASGLVVAGAGWFPLALRCWSSSSGPTRHKPRPRSISCSRASRVSFVIWMLHAIALSVFAERLC
jgi:hypothetical protein